MALFAGSFAGSPPSTLELSPPTWKWVECPALWIKNVNSDEQQFPQYQQNKQLTLTSTHWT
jgi:hypothetical protein